jgi:histidyl-tRNA synthetase
LGAQNAVCGGGRYDTLVEELGGNSTPAMGFAIGLERLVDILNYELRITNYEKGIKLYIAALGEEAGKIGFDMLQKARKAGISADMDFIGKGLKAQMKAADRQKAKYVLIIGDEEIKKDKFILKNMRTADQEEVSLEDIIARLPSLA